MNNFHKLSTKFDRKLNEILDSDNVIEEQHIKDAGRFLNKFAALHISEPEEIKRFLKNVRVYFVFLKTFEKQFQEMNPHQEYTIRLAVEIFLNVVDSTKIHQKIITMFVRIIDAMLESDAPNGNMKEYIGVYLYLLDRVPKDCIQKLAVKHKSYPNLYNIIKNTCDIATQAIIVELVSKLNKYSTCTRLSKTFMEFLSIAEITSCDGIFIYQNMRRILNHLNEDSNKNFSINCVTIELDSARVLEFKGAENTNGIWLDFNLLREKLSCFCDKSFTCLINATSWQVLSFSPKDMLRITFEYDKFSENLIILCKIKSSSFALFQQMKFVRNMNLKIVISKYSERFRKLIKDVLPKLFKDRFSFESLNISSEQNDSSATPDIEIVNNSEDSSPVIEHFEKPRKKISTKNKDYLPVKDTSANMPVESIITISDDESEKNIGAITIIDDSFREENMRLSIVRVTSWLNQVTTPSPLLENEITQQPLQTPPMQISQRSSDLPLEKRLEILMQEEVEDEVPVLNKDNENQTRTTLDLVHLLENQEVTTVGNAVKQTTTSSTDSEIIPLIVLKKKLQIEKSSGSTKPAKRKLYNPGDLTYMSKTCTEEYLNNKEPTERNFLGSNAPKLKSKDKTKQTEVSNLKTKNNSNRSTSKKQNTEPKVMKLRSNRTKPTKSKVKTPRKGALELRKSDIFRNNTKNKTHLPDSTFTKVFNSLKEKIREHEKESKERRRKLGLKRRSSSVSLDSMEPFGVAVSNSLKKTKLEKEEHHSGKVEVNEEKN